MRLTGDFIRQAAARFLKSLIFGAGQLSMGPVFRA